MLHCTRYTIFFLVLICCTGIGFAQSGFYVPAAGKIFFNGDTATIFSNVINMGKMGVGQKAVVNFTGKLWVNDPLAMITDESNNGEGANGIGGLVRFRGDSVQQLDAGYNAATRTGPTFAKLELQNKLGMQLVSSSAKIRQQLHLQNGLFYLQNNILVVGDGNPGSITGYDSSRYIITANTAASGLLIRENITVADGMVTFPIGSKAYSYTPAAIRALATSAGDDYYANVFDGTKRNAVSGDNLTDSSANTTWEIGKRFRPGQDEVEIYLQHKAETEGAYFRENRVNSYIAFYNNNVWDTASPPVNIPSGYLTSGPPIENSYVHNRTFTNTLPATGYFTKLVNKAGIPLPKTNLVFNGYRVNANTVFTYWATKPEVNIKYFVVQRRLDNETDFSNRDTVQSKAPNGFSNVLLRYSNDDYNPHTSYSYYRLMMVDYNGNISYSNIIVVGGVHNKLLVKIWPNPSPTGRFFVGINTPLVVKSIVVWDVLGQKLMEEQVINRNVIPMYLPRPGSYFIGFFAEAGHVLETHKLIITGY